MVSLDLRSGAYSRAALINLVGLGAALIRSAALIRGFTVFSPHALGIYLQLISYYPGGGELCS